jgi:nucleotide-binding universal stress UspA family protein
LHSDEVQRLDYDTPTGLALEPDGVGGLFRAKASARAATGGRRAWKETAMLPIRSILHPTDFSANSESAFQLALTLARDYGARLAVVHVAPPPLTVYGDGLYSPLPANFDEGLKEKLNEFEGRTGNVSLEKKLYEGDPASEILRAAHEFNADLIVLGTHGRSGLSRLLMGSVAEQVVRKAPCPVLTVKVPLPEKQTIPAPEASAIAEVS